MLLDTPLISAAVLFEADRPIGSAEEIGAALGSEIAGLVRDVCKMRLGRLRAGDEDQAASYRRMLLSAATDMRVLLRIYCCSCALKFTVGEHVCTGEQSDLAS